MIRTGNKSDLKDGYFLGRSCTDIIADLAAGVFTLAGISALQVSEQVRIGWLNNPIINLLYKVGSSGLWVAREQTADGQCPTEELRNYHMQVLQKPASMGLIDQTTIAQLTAYYLQRRIGYLDITLAGGTKADNELVPALAGYYGVMRVLAIGSNTPDTYTWTFQDEDNTLLAGGISGVLMPEVTAAHVPVNLYPGYVFTQATKTDNKALEVDVTGGAGVEHVIIIYEYWYET